jgi:hypothetical protein
MDDQSQQETGGVPWADHNETPSTPPDTRREEYGDSDPSQNVQERAADLRDERDEDENDEGDLNRRNWGENPIYDL